MKELVIGQRTLSVSDEGQGRPLLLVHGFPLDHSMWSEQIAELQSDCRIIAPDLFGFGNSQPVDAEDEKLTMSQMADDLAEILSQLEISEPVYYCGLSMGGYVGWQFYRRHKEKLRGLIMCDTRAAADSEEVARGRMMMAQKTLAGGPAELIEPMVGRLFSESTMATQLDVVARTREVMLGTDPRSIAAALRGMAERDSAEDLLAEIDLPVLFVCGEDDGITPLTEMKAMADAVQGARLVSVPKAGHMAPLESPVVVNQAIREFAS